MTIQLPKLPKAVLAPLDLLIDAFPKSSTSISAVQGVICITAITVPVQEIKAPKPAVDWITSYTPTYHTQAGTLVIDLKVDQNTGEQRETSVVVECAGETLGKIRICQFGGAFVQFRQAQLLNTPMNMDYGIAAKFLAQEVAKIPEPFTIIGVIIVAIVIVVVNVVAALLRHLFFAVPEPAALAPLQIGVVIPPNLDLTATPIPVEDNLILNQTLLTVLYFVLTVFDGGE